MRISDWSSDVCSSDLGPFGIGEVRGEAGAAQALLQVGQHVVADPDGERFDLHGCRPLFFSIVTASGGEQSMEIGRASCRERVCQYVWISVGAVSLKKKKQQIY